MCSSDLNEIKDSNEFKAFSNIFRQGDRIFFISSIFGGTGASGFPIMVKNIRQAASLEGIENRDALSRAPIGGLTVLPYFTLEGNKQDQRIATSDFIVKTQSALYVILRPISRWQSGSPFSKRMTRNRAIPLFSLTGWEMRSFTIPRFIPARLMMKQYYPPERTFLQRTWTSEGEP